ncbi:HAD family hydrolase [Alsobacter sp. R-9]
MTTPRWPAAVVFDLDGTLVDSAPDIAEALNEVLAEDGRPTHALAQVRRMVGHGVHRLVERAYGDGAPTDVVAARTARFVTRYEPRAARLTTLTAGAPEAVAACLARGAKVAVCTNKPGPAAVALLRGLDLHDPFHAVLGGDTGLPLKPHPAMLHAVLDGFGVGPEDALFVGDSKVDHDCARAAGVAVVLVRGGYGEHSADDLAADAVIDSLHDLEAVLARFGDTGRVATAR